MPVKHPEDLRLVAVAMARMVGPEQTAEDLKIDVRTVKSWVAATPPRSGVTDDEEAWQAAEKVALYRNLRALARGEIRDTIRLNNLAGTARDKLFRWATRREARREAEPEQPEQPPDPILEQIDRLDSRRKRLLASEIDAELEERVDRYGRTGEASPVARTSTREPDALAYWAAEVDRLLAIPDDEVEQQIAALDVVLYPPAAWPQPPEAAEPEPVEAPDTPEQVPTPIRPVPAAQEPVPMVLDVGYRRDDGPWYDLDTGERRPRYR